MNSPETIFGAINSALAADPALGKKVGGVIQFVLTGSDGKAEWLVDCKEGVAKSGKAAKADCTITISGAGLPLAAALPPARKPLPPAAALCKRTHYAPVLLEPLFLPSLAPLCL